MSEQGRIRRKGYGKGDEQEHPLYRYVCELEEQTGFPLLHTHRIFLKRRGLDSRLRLLILVLACSVLVSRLFSVVKRGESLQWMIVIAALLYLQWHRCRVEQEAVVVMPTLGVQLETVYCSKSVKRRFVPLHRILLPVINEAVTPTTCYSYLALLLRDESRLTLTFLHVRPPLSMLVPIRAALCAAVEQPSLQTAP
jgi:phosphatidylinositol glycan class H protein